VYDNVLSQVRVGLMSEARNSPDPTNTRAGRLILLVAGILTALGLLGAAGKSAYENWSWVKDVLGSSKQVAQKNPLEDMAKELGGK
jgi:hypothetical protein